MEGQQKAITVLGAGSWGTALALNLSRKGQEVRLWSPIETEIVALINDRANNQYLPGHLFPEALSATSDLSEALSGVEDVLVAVPSFVFRDTIVALKPLIKSSTSIICATKGLDAETGKTLNAVVEEVLGKDQPFAVLSGPSFAKEVAAGLPTAVTIASEHASLAQALKRRFDSPIFRVVTSSDVEGVELGGLVKNVIAIATGICDGLGFGANTRSAIITLGLAEIISLGTTLGAKAETFTGLSGMGDLILTCSDDQSRNRRMGLALGRGETVAEAEESIGQVVEGKRNAELVVKLARQHQVNMPICEAVQNVLIGMLPAKSAVEEMFKA